MISATLLSEGRTLDAVEILMSANCFLESISHLLEQNLFILAAQVNAVVENEENSKAFEMINTKWISHMQKVRFDNS